MVPADLSGLPVLLELLTEATLAGSVALLLVLVLRRPLRNAFGATVAYLAWALVPAAIVAVALPAATQTVAAAPVAIVMSTAVVPLATLPAAAPFDVAPWLLAAWLAGAVVMALRLGRQQRAFRRGLGLLRLRADGLQQAESVAGLPAAVGLLRPAIVVPADFDTRYSGEERALMHAHERSHIAHGDLQLNALVAMMRSVFWFNPLLHNAVRHFRHDQELACDQRVIARHPHGRRVYGEAMFKTQLASQPLPLGCHWGYSHPLKERIAMLKQPTPSAARWIGGGALVLVLALGVGFAAWSAQPKREAIAHGPSAGLLMTQVEMRVDGGQPERATMIGSAGEPMAMRSEHAGRQWEMQATATPRADGMIAVATTLSRDGKLVGSPQLLVRHGEDAAVRIRENNGGGDAFDVVLDLRFSAATPGAPPVPPSPPAPPVATPPPPAAPAPPAPPAPDRAGTRVAPAPAPPPARLDGAVAPRPPAPPTPVAAPARPALRDESGVNRTPAPEYPATALAQKIGGMVVLEIDIDASGKPVNVEVVKSEPAGVFDQAAVDAVSQWQLRPAIVDGKPVPGRVRVPVEFAARSPAAAPAR